MKIIENVYMVLHHAMAFFGWLFFILAFYGLASGKFDDIEKAKAEGVKALAQCEAKLPINQSCKLIAVPIQAEQDQDAVGNTH